MKIEDLRNKTVDFSKIDTGNCFEYNGKVYIKHHSYSNITNATNLATGESTLFGNGNNVIPIDAKLVIEN